MREFLAEKMPKLSSRIHGKPDGEAGQEVQTRTPLDSGVDGVWTWEGAESRLKAAYEKNGFSGWAEAALKELEAEEEQERLRREGLTEENKPS